MGGYPTTPLQLVRFLPEVAAIVPPEMAKRHPRFIRARVFHLVLGRQGRQLEGVVWFPPRLVIEGELLVVEVVVPFT